jgi:hypothetical protein
MSPAIGRPTTATLKRLFTLSGNRCAFPKCSSAIVVGGTVVGKVCHIRARSPEGPRYDRVQTPDARHGFDNLILLCGTHHTVIDDDDETYTVERLEAMKRAHEASVDILSDDAGLDGAITLSFNQSGGITAQSVSVEAVHFHAPGDEASHLSRQAQAIALLAPELARVLAHQIFALDRAIANFFCSSVGHALPGDHWTVFHPRKPSLYPVAVQVRDLDAPNAALLAEFYSLLEEIDDMITAWRAAELPWDTNSWNVLMQKIGRSVTAGVAATNRFCPGRLYDATMPVIGTLAERATKSVGQMQKNLELHIARARAELAQSRGR